MPETIPEHPERRCAIVCLPLVRGGGTACSAAVTVGIDRHKLNKLSFPRSIHSVLPSAIQLPLLRGALTGAPRHHGVEARRRPDLHLSLITKSPEKSVSSSGIFVDPYFFVRNTCFVVFRTSANATNSSGVQSDSNSSIIFAETWVDFCKFP